MNKLALTAAALCALAAPAAYLAAQDVAVPGVADASRVTAGTYAVDPNHTLVQWQVDHLGFNPYFGLFGDAEGSLTIDPRALGQAKVDISLPISSLTVVNQALRDHMTRPGEDGGAPDFFGADAGMARFVSSKVTPTGTQQASIEGTLTMNGKSAPVVLAARFTGAGSNPMSKVETIGFSAQTTIRRSQWGIGYGIPMVSDDVALTITAAFEKQ